MTDLKPALAPVRPTDLPSCAPDNPLEALEWLGATVEEVAEGLRARGIKGTRLIANSCPLANYLKEWWANPSVFVEVSIIDDDKDYYFTAKNPTVTFLFAQLFDMGRYPDLEA